MEILVVKKPVKGFPMRIGACMNIKGDTFEYYRSTEKGIKNVKIDVNKCVRNGYFVEVPKNLDGYDAFLKWKQRQLQSDEILKISQNYNI